jgi:hypothetical protein
MGIALQSGKMTSFHACRKGFAVGSTTHSEQEHEEPAAIWVLKTKMWLMINPMLHKVDCCQPIQYESLVIQPLTTY